MGPERALLSPDIIPADVAGWAIQEIKDALATHRQYLSCRITDEGTAIGVHQVQRRWQTREPYLSRPSASSV